MKPAVALNMADMRRAARARAHKMVFDYIDGGSDDEQAMVRNRAAFQQWTIAHKVLTGVGRVETKTRLLGTDLAVPFLLSPAACQRLFHTQGERAAACAAADMGTVFCLSTLSSVSMEEIAALTPAPKWFQLYVWKDRGLVREMVQRAKAAGYKALVLTVDLPRHGNRERDPRNGLTIPPKITLKTLWQAVRRPTWSYDYLTGSPIRFANLSHKQDAASLADFIAAQLSPDFTWDDAEWLLGEWVGPALIKGVVRADDAKRAVTTGFQGIMLSNHGGRQLDASPAPIQALSEVAAAVGDGTALIVDGGVRRGTDIIKVMALGADAVSFARPYLYGLAAGGRAGVDQALNLMRDGLERDMALAGVSSIQEMDMGLLRSANF